MDRNKARREPDVERLRSIFVTYPDIQAVYQFGSAATGRLPGESDLDLAIVARTPDLRVHKLALLTDLARQGFCDVDLLFLDEADIVTQYEAVCHNRLIYEAEDFDRGALYARVVGRYLGFLPYLAVQLPKTGCTSASRSAVRQARRCQRVAGVLRGAGAARAGREPGSGFRSHAQQTALIMQRFEPVVLEYNPDWVIVPGDVVASRVGVKVAHVEAGLRSFDRTMPEEIDRVVTDHEQGSGGDKAFVLWSLGWLGSCGFGMAMSGA